MFTEYPLDAVLELCEPTHGIATQVSYIPSIAACKAFLEDHTRVLNDQRRNQLRYEREQQEMAREWMIIEEEKRQGKRKTYDELIAKLPPSLRVHNKGKDFPSWVLDKSALLEKHKITQEQFEEIFSKPQEEPNPFL